MDNSIVKKLSKNEMTEECFVVSCPIGWVIAAIVTTVVFIILTIIYGLEILLYSPAYSQEYPPPSVWYVLVGAAGAVFFGYLSLYHGTFETRVTGDEITHKELFHARYTFSFSDITRIKLRGFGGFARLTLYSENEVLLIAEETYYGYELLVNRLKRAGVWVP